MIAGKVNKSFETSFLVLTRSDKVIKRCICVCIYVLYAPLPFPLLSLFIIWCKICICIYPLIFICIYPLIFQYIKWTHRWSWRKGFSFIPLQLSHSLNEPGCLCGLYPPMSNIQLALWGCEVRIVNILHFFGLSLQITALVKSLVTFIPHKLGNILGMTLTCSHYGGIRTLIKHLYDILFLSPYHLQNVLSHYRLLNIVLKYVSNKASNKASSNYITLNIYHT